MGFDEFRLCSSSKKMIRVKGLYAVLTTVVSNLIYPLRKKKLLRRVPSPRTRPNRHIRMRKRPLMLSLIMSDCNNSKRDIRRNSHRSLMSRKRKTEWGPINIFP